MRLYVHHVIAAGYCSKGLVAKLKRFGWENGRIMDALANGLEEEEVSIYGDAQIQKVIRVAHEQEQSSNG